jgi:hypothetical protein
MNQQTFELGILLAIALFALAAIGAVASIIRQGRRASAGSFVASLPTARVPESSWRPALARAEKRDAIENAQTIAVPAPRWDMATNGNEF